jgi:DNA repair protein RadD
MLREYQRRAIDMLYAWLEKNAGHPCLVLPTGSGKSHIVAALCKDAVQNWPETRILMLTHVKELIQQNAEKMRQHWPGAPLGIYSASLRRRQLDEPITFAGIQSIISQMDKIGHVDLVIIDECHLVNHKEHGSYRVLIDHLAKVNPSLRVVGLTATPYRLGHGMITDAPALFWDLIEPVSVEELIYKGFLSPLRSKATAAKIDVGGVHKRGGEYIEAELQAAADTDALNTSTVDEVIARSEGRKAWLFFCTGVRHAERVRDELRKRGITAECVLGDTSPAERDRIIADFRAGRVRALTNANVLTTGFDYPDIDLIALLRPTCSPGLYVQMVGRGMRLKSEAKDCLVLDFAGCVATHGPIIAVQPPRKPGKGTAPPAMTKTCPNCDEVVALSVRKCPVCDYEWQMQPVKLELRDDDIMGRDGKTMAVKNWSWRKHVSRTSGKEMLAVSYYPADYAAPVVVEYLPIMHDGYAGQKSRGQLMKMAASASIDWDKWEASVWRNDDMIDLARILSNATPPREIEYRQDGKFFRVIKRRWERDEATA